MKQWFLIGIAAVAVFLFFLYFGTKPAVEKESKMNNQVNVTTGKQWETAPDMQIDTTKKYSAIITTSKGDLTVELLAGEAPKTVNNFVFLAREGFYDGVPFHRIIKDFMVQTGDPTGTGTGGPGYKFADEPVTRNYDRGIVAMANAGPNTNGSQFFIMTQNNTTLPKNYTIFGQIAASDVESIKTLDALANTPVEASANGEESKPTESVTIEKVVISEQ